jgi:hypothetical protein
MMNLTLYFQLSVRILVRRQQSSIILTSAEKVRQFRKKGLAEEIMMKKTRTKRVRV